VFKYPIYIVSKGRSDSALTAKMFVRNNIRFKIVVEPQEYDDYCKVIKKENVLKLSFKNLGVGSFPARNFCWENSIKNESLKHWVFDDNIRCFSRLNKGKRTKASPELCIKNAEKFTDRFINVAVSGFNYRYFVTNDTKKPYVHNVHVYSALLIRNDIKYRWRLKYNEDVDLCLQVLNDGWCTVLFNAFLIDKTSTVCKMKGGNQAELYQNNANEKKMLKAKSLERIWPQYVTVVKRFGRPHHLINWKKHFPHCLKKIRV